jgi:TRAP-type C4-dicarboxylate transport system permease small subunit
MSAAFAAALCIPYCALKREHAIMDIILSHLPLKLRWALQSISGIINAGFMALMMYAGSRYAYEKTLVFEKARSSGMPVWIFRWVWVLGMALVALALVLETIDFVRNLLGRKAYNSLEDPKEGAGDERAGDIEGIHNGI